MAIKITYHFTKDQVKNGYRSAWHRMVMDLFDLIAQYSQELIAAGPFNEGNLLRSLNQYFEDEMTGYIGYTAPYAKPVEFGSKPHFPPPDAIREWARNKLGLRGRELERATWGICRKIDQYGTEAQPFLRPATEMASPKVGGLYTKHLAREGLA